MENKERLQRFIEKLCNETNSTVNAVDSKLYERGEDYIEISNKFARVFVRRVFTRNGVRLEICSPSAGYRTYLDPLELESLTRHPKSIFNNLLREPWARPD